MVNKKREMLIPQYMHKFKCIGSSCEDSCCIGWRVQIDKNTYKQYRKCKNKELQGMLGEKVKRNRSSSSKYDYAEIKMNNGNSCPFLTQDKLCKIHSNLGEEYLSITCTQYPRIFNAVNGVLEKCATMSCPEIARLALLNPEVMQFDYIEPDISRKNAFNDKIDTNQSSTENKIEKYFWNLRIFTIEVLQNRDYELWERLIILGMFYEKLSAYIKEENMDETLNLIENYRNNIKNGIFHEYLKEIPSYKNIQMVILKELTNERILKGIENRRYLECFLEFMQGMGYTGKATNEELVKKYEKAYTKYYEPYMKEHEYILENYLVNYVFKNLFPVREREEVFDNYVMLVMHYAMIKMHLIGISAFHKEKFCDEHIVKLIQSFAKTVEHNNIFLEYMYDLLKKDELATMAYMSILIKN
ncbi:flagellin lysine-N-methylase [Haloimpatiens sp. FM7330]|uniref:flagellin lysine-N-methylase n=1 Tax=Haloimpatiens sp. FM7330 TaxID=3298610 RepID=UPI00363409FE